MILKDHTEISEKLLSQGWEPCVREGKLLIFVGQVLLSDRSASSFKDLTHKNMDEESGSLC